MHKLKSLSGSIILKLNSLCLLLKQCLLLGILHHQHLLWVNHLWHSHHILHILLLILLSVGALVLTVSIALIKRIDVSWLLSVTVVLLLLGSSRHLVHWVELLHHLSRWLHLLHHHVLVVLVVELWWHELLLIHVLVSIIELLLIATIISSHMLTWRSLSKLFITMCKRALVAKFALT